MPNSISVELSSLYNPFTTDVVVPPFKPQNMFVGKII